MPTPYFPTPFDFVQVMYYLGQLIDGEGYQYTVNSALPTDATTYASNIVWNDAKSQPTWEYITPGGDGWTAYNTYYQNSNYVTNAMAEVAFAQLTADLTAKFGGN